MAVGTWYFTRDKEAQIGNPTVYGAISTSLYYHSGTAAFGSLIIAIIKTIRAMVYYIQKKTKDSQNKVIQVSELIVTSPVHLASRRRPNAKSPCRSFNAFPCRITIEHDAEKRSLALNFS